MKNLITRTFTGIIFVALLVSAICLHPIAFLLLFSLITGLTLWEFSGLINRNLSVDIQRTINVVAGMYLFVASFAYANGLADGRIFLPYLFFILLTVIAELYYKATNPVTNWAYTLFAQIYCAGTFSLLNFMGAEQNATGTTAYSPLLVIALFVFIWLDDTGAYMVGSMIGKHKLFERISPKKSWEGFFGGLFFALAASQLFASYAPQIDRLHWLGLSATVVLFGTWGDLTESLLKRTIGVKDSGNILPGHGGMLDRFDSVMIAIPAAYVYIELFIRN